jgi:hypothetical protein
MNRRHFLIAGCGGLCLALAGCGMGTTATMCPYGESDDPYPGKCHRYVDLDQDGICDLSQSASAAGEAVTHEGCDGRRGRGDREQQSRPRGDR